MKKSIILLLCALPLLFVSCSKKVKLNPVELEPIVIQEGNVSYQMDPRAELLMIAMRLAEVDSFTFESSNDYVSGIDKIFEKYKEHAFVKQLKKHCKNFEGGIGCVLSISSYIEPDFSKLNLDKKNLPIVVEAFYCDVNLDEFITNLNDFAANCNFARISKLYDKEIKRCLNNVKEFYVKNDKLFPWVQDLTFSAQNSVEYEFIVSPLLGNALMSDIMYEKDGKDVIRVYQRPGLDQQSHIDVYSLLGVENAIFGKYIINNWDKLSVKIKSIVDTIYQENKYTVKKMKNLYYVSEFSSLLVLGIIDDYVLENKDEAIAKEFIDYFNSNNLYKNMDKVENLMDYYKSHRTEYPNFQQFLTEYAIDVINKDF